MQEGRDFRSREQQEQQELEDKTKGTPVVSKLIKRRKSGRSKVLERLCDLATLWALVQFPTVVAAYEIQRYDVMKGYGAILASVVLLMATVLVLNVRDDVQWHWKSFRDSVRRSLEMLSYFVWLAVVLLAMVMILASAFNGANHPKAAAFITDL